MNNTTRSESNKRRILDAARDLFAEKGFHQTGMAQVSSISGVAPFQIYRYFAGKEALIAVICEEEVHRWLDHINLEHAIARNDPAAVRRWISRFGGITNIERLFNTEKMMTEIIAEVGRNPRLAVTYEKLDSRVRQYLSQALRFLASDTALEEHILRSANRIMEIGFGSLYFGVLKPDYTNDAKIYAEYLIDHEITFLN